MVSRLRSDQARAADENVRLTQEIVALRGRLSDSEGTSAEITALRDEREIIRTRVTDMLEQLEHLSL
jgi:regulator of replication initiation timing